MHVLILVGLIPLSVLGGVIGFVALTLVVALATQFPVIFLAGLCFGVVGYKLSNLNRSHGVPCGQV